MLCSNQAQTRSEQVQLGKQMAGRGNEHTAVHNLLTLSCKADKYIANLQSGSDLWQVKRAGRESLQSHYRVITESLQTH